MTGGSAVAGRGGCGGGCGRRRRRDPLVAPRWWRRPFYFRPPRRAPCGWRRGGGRRRPRALAPPPAARRRLHFSGGRRPLPHPHRRVVFFFRSRCSCRLGWTSVAACPPPRPVRPLLSKRGDDGAHGGARRTHRGAAAAWGGRGGGRARVVQAPLAVSLPPPQRTAPRVDRRLSSGGGRSPLGGSAGRARREARDGGRPFWALHRDAPPPRCRGRRCGWRWRA